MNELPRKTFLEKLEPADILAAIILIGGLVLIGLGINGIVGGLVVAIVAYYFGKRELPPKSPA